MAQVTAARGVAPPERWVRIEAAPDGMVRFEARLHADLATLLMKAIDIARAEDVSAETPPAERPSRADALVRVAETFVAGDRAGGRPGGERHQLVVCVEANALMPDGVSAEMDGTGVQAPPKTLKRLPFDASVCAAQVDAEGAPLSVGRKTRTTPGALVCPAHHRLLHEGRYTMTRDAAGALSFHRPDGSVVERVPRPPEASLELPLVERRRAAYAERPDYNMAIGVIAPLQHGVI